MKADRTRVKKTDADLDEIDAIKAEFRREDQALARAGHARKVLERNLAALGIDIDGELPRLVSVNGVRLRS